MYALLISVFTLALVVNAALRTFGRRYGAV